MKLSLDAFIALARWLLTATFFVGLFFVSRTYPLFFGVVTFLLSLLLFSRVEFDRNAHERTFYSPNEPSKIFSSFLNLTSKGEVLLKSLVFGLLAVILFSGTDYHRIVKVALIFVLVVVVGAATLNIIEKKSSLHIERLGYVKISLLLGVAFSFLISLHEGLSLWEITTILVTHTTSGLNLREAAELIYGLFAQLDDLIENIFVGLFGSFIGKFISLILTANVTYGFIIYIYAVQYLRLQKRYQIWVERKLKKHIARQEIQENGTS